MDIAFFVAPDDDAAAATRNRGPGEALTPLACHDFSPDDATVEWAMYFEAPSAQLPPIEELYMRGRPRYVAPIVNDGTGVFALDRGLTSALAGASPSVLGELAARWRERLWFEDGDDMTDDSPVEILQGVARLAAIALRTGAGLYCWHF
ncbi:hypothetical protein [Streptacidiphilus sp. EB129]|uniref:hypothetical protein n=1 Tax=Streptacidiphilus sp. EB129 TaxID=3156262 RepID=UPI003517F578